MTTTATSIQRLVFLVGFLDLAGVMVMLPLFVVQLRHMGLSPLVGGVIRSLYSLLQLVSSPVVGRWSDQWGRRPLLLVSLAASSLGYLVLGATSSLTVIMVSRVVTGVFKHSTTLSRAVLADVTQPEDRPRVMGIFGAAMGAAVVLAPALGGHLAGLHNGFTIVCSLSSAMFFLNLVLCVVLLPVSLPIASCQPSHNPHRAHDPTAEAPGDVGGWSPWVQVGGALRQVDWHLLWDIFLVDFLLTFSIFAFRSSFVLLVDQVFDVGPVNIGYLVSFQGLVGVVAGLLAGPVARLYGGHRERQLFHAAVLQTLSLVGLSVASSIVAVVVCLVPLALATTVATTTTATITIDRCPHHKLGSVTGVAQGIPAVAGMTTPILGGLAHQISLQGPGLLASLSAALGATMAGCVALRGTPTHGSVNGTAPTIKNKDE